MLFVGGGTPSNEAAKLSLDAAEVIAFPTETVWGLGALPTPTGAALLAERKGRSGEKALQISCSSWKVAARWAASEETLRRAARFWPGPLTLVTPARDGTDDALARGGWVGLRVPAHPTARALLAANGGALLTTSCNNSGQPPVRSAAEARASGLADRVLDEGEDLVLGVPSTVLRLSEGGGEIIRMGALRAEELRLAGLI